MPIQKMHVNYSLRNLRFKKIFLQDLFFLVFLLYWQVEVLEIHQWN